MQFVTHVRFWGVFNVTHRRFTGVFSINNSHKRDTAGNMRIPVIPDDADAPGTILKKYIFENLSPGQVRIHCYSATASQLAYFKFSGKPNAMYSPSQPIGKNAVNDRFKKAGMIMNLSKPLHGHSLRRLAITKMVCGGVSITEVMSAARHTSVSASSAYIQRNQSSDLMKLQALGINVALKSD
jgi:hypothetical protein